MGIPSYFAFIIKNFPNIIEKYAKQNVDNLYLDSNSIIYDSVHSIDYTNNDQNFENILLKKVCDTIDSYIYILNPKNVFITFDGVAPFAKLNQQKTRRYKSWFIENMEKKISSSKNKEKWNTTAITPGTIFMEKLNNYIKNNYIKNRNNINKNVNIIFSGSDEPGEGEHKIFNKIRNDNNHKNQDTIVYGLDADLIMLCLHHKHLCKSINLYRETPHFIKQLNKSLNPNEQYILNIDILSDKIIETMTSNKNLDKDDLIHDYIFICFLLGNDFIPHHPSFNIRKNGIFTLLDCYKHLNKNNKQFILTKNSTILWSNFRKYISLLSEMEEELLQGEHEHRDKFENKYIPNKTEEERLNKFGILPSYDRSTEHFINPFENGWQSRYYNSLFHIQNDTNRIKNICFNYLEALEWTFTYYTKGCKDWKWKYNYNYAPLYKDLIKYIPFFDTDLLETKQPDIIPNIVQLSYVLPETSYSLLPKNVENLLRNKFNTNGPYKLSWSYTKYFYETHVDFPDIDINKLQQEISYLS
jgi:5'-3' exonuclease